MKIRVRTKRRKPRGPDAVAHREPLAVALGPDATRVAFTWYTPETWQDLRLTADDPEALDDTYEAWLAAAEAALHSLEDRDIHAVRFPLDVPAAAAWAKEQGRAFDSAARAAYVAIQRPEKKRH